MEFENGLSLRSVNMLQTGRHLRLTPQVKIIVGKNETENNLLRQMTSENEIIMELADYQGPTTLFIGPSDEQTLELAAAITAGYSKAPSGEQVRVFTAGDCSSKVLNVFPLDRNVIRTYFVNRL